MPHLFIDNPPGYKTTPFYGVSKMETEERVLGLVSNKAKDFINKEKGDRPWACFVSVIEPHDPFISTKKFYDMYENIDIELPKSFNDNLNDKPNIYKRDSQNCQEKHYPQKGNYSPNVCNQSMTYSPWENKYSFNIKCNK